ncbi:MAG: transporter [Rickettsiales bacterium]|jgi:hypothetical protein|nr:transporter [Rickettsiales bacterium]
MQISYLVRIITITLCFLFNTAYANIAGHAKRPDDHAPIGVMRDHVHHKGEFMASYRIGYMKMKNLINGDDDVSNSEALNSYNMIPTEMTMKMHMIGLMYGIGHNFNISVMGSFIEKDMDNYGNMSGAFFRDSQGVGDTKINTSYQFYNNDNIKALFNLAISLPTGDIDESYDGSRLAYAMQIGSGSYDILPGLSFNKSYNDYSYGGQLNAIFRTDMNDNGYKFGDQYNSTIWAARRINNNYSISTRFNYTKTEAIEGFDNSLTIGMMPTANPALYEREKLELLIGVNFIATNNNIMNGNRLALEFGIPIYERVDGPMLASDYRLILGWQQTF